ncbi:hypothetical protein [Algisphaera agarilytica]|uniref:GTPase n=1 Tax=Algisphaera agarilytica TaxID=1385975 RepID=A0A7X0HC49_9BACT|nr:hypothetical protein [Algisphaera agarilytica]MBB6431650.1 hypothetical protein [Algisphaera agarilytica]
MKLIFVYNADAGWLGAAWDSAHKLISPKTYRCSLCAVTHHALGMKKRWARFIEGLEHDIEFLHRDEAKERYDLETVDWPAVLKEDEKEARIWLNSEELAHAETIEQLEALIRERLDHENTSIP